jgi:hypothetical protein
MQTWEIVAIIAAALVVAAIAWAFYSRQQSKHLRTHFGQEYDRTVSEFGDRRSAESNLRQRESRLSKLEIRPLTMSDRQRFRSEWNACQSHFVDDPVAAVYEADDLILEMMRARGYPVDDENERFEDISAAYPTVTNNYREARSIVERHRQGEADTEEMRQAMVHYRELFGELLGGESHEELRRAS